MTQALPALLPFPLPSSTPPHTQLQPENPFKEAVIGSPHLLPVSQGSLPFVPDVHSLASYFVSVVSCRRVNLILIFRLDYEWKLIHGFVM